MVKTNEHVRLQIDDELIENKLIEFVRYVWLRFEVSSNSIEDTHNEQRRIHFSWNPRPLTSTTENKKEHVTHR